MGEHSPVDALVPSMVAEYALVQRLQADAFEEDAKCPSEEDALVSLGWKRLDWIVDDRIEQECAKAEERANEVIDNSDDSVLWFADYGTNWIKNDGRSVVCISDITDYFP